MAKDQDVLKCFSCGQTYSLVEYSEKKSIICSGCGMEAVPITLRGAGEKNTKEFWVLLGFFAIVALLGALGTAMMVHGWNFWVTFTMIGGILYLVGKIFVSNYKIYEIGKYQSNKIITDMQRDSETDFDGLVVDAIHELPKRLRDRLSNMSVVVVEDKPDNSMLEKLKLTSDKTLLGVFQGIPLNKKSVWHSGTMPERITIFKSNIEGMCRSEDEIKQIIRKVVRHEVAHFVGFTEEEIRELGY